MFIRTNSSRLSSIRNLSSVRGEFWYALSFMLSVWWWQLDMANDVVMCSPNNNGKANPSDLLPINQAAAAAAVVAVGYEVIDGTGGGDIERLNKSANNERARKLLLEPINPTTTTIDDYRDRLYSTQVVLPDNSEKFLVRESPSLNLELSSQQNDLLRLSSKLDGAEEGGRRMGANLSKKIEVDNMNNSTSGRTNKIWKSYDNNNNSSSKAETTALMHLKEEALQGFGVPIIKDDTIDSVRKSGGKSTQAKNSLRSVGGEQNRQMVDEPTMIDRNYYIENDEAQHDGENDLIGSAESKQKFDNDDLNCALILKRTYILNNKSGGQGDEWGDKYVFNDSDSEEEDGENEIVDERMMKKDKKRKSNNNNNKLEKKKREQTKKQKLIHKTDLCIKHSDVDRAIEEAKHELKFKQANDAESLDISADTVAQVGELNLLASSLLVKQFDLSHDEILNALPMIDMSSSNFFMKDLCPKHVRPMVCLKSRYRTITAHCNNLRHPSWGAAKTPYARYLPPDYADGIGKPRASRVDNRPLPSARLISSLVHIDSDEPSHDYSILFADWGQLLNHDITRVAVGKAADCCPNYLKGLCMPIPVPASDPLYSKFKVNCLKFDRSLPAIRAKCLLGVRSPFNLITSAVDASFVYGSTKQQATNLRTFSEGKLKVWNYFETHKLKPLLPPQLQKPDEECLGRPKNLYCFIAGDVRVNEQTHLTVLHTLYVREHNRLAKLLGQMNLDWDDDKIYHETRHIVAACVQHVMTNEFLPLLLGPKLMNEYELGPMGMKDAGGDDSKHKNKNKNKNNNNNNNLYWHGYDPSTTISTGAGFAAAAFRYGHSMIESKIRRLDPKSGSLISSELLRFLLKRPFVLYEPGAIDQLTMGMLLTPAEQTDPFMSEELSGHLFQPPKAKFGHDLAAINIQRGKCGEEVVIGRGPRGNIRGFADERSAIGHSDNAPTDVCVMSCGHTC